MAQITIEVDGITEMAAVQTVKVIAGTGLVDVYGLWALSLICASGISRYAFPSMPIDGDEYDGVDLILLKKAAEYFRDVAVNVEKEVKRREQLLSDQ